MATANNYGFIIPAKATEVVQKRNDQLRDLKTTAPAAEDPAAPSNAEQSQSSIWSQSAPDGAELSKANYGLDEKSAKKAVAFFPVPKPETQQMRLRRDDSTNSLREDSTPQRSRSGSMRNPKTDEEGSMAERSRRASFHEGASFGSRRGGSEGEESFNRSMSSLNKNSQLLRSQHTVNNLLAMGGIGGPAGKQGDMVHFKKDVDVVRKRLKTISHRTLDPRSNFVRTWDTITILALAFTAFVTPFEVSFFAAQIYSGPINFTLNRMVDGIFFCDIVVTFFLPYRAALKDGGMMVYDNRKIAIAYLKGWFFLDLITCIPFDVFCAAIASAGGVTVDASVYSFMRMFRILKLVRIIRAARIIGRWQDHIAVSFALLSLIKFSFLTIILAHWLACLWGFVGVRWADLPESTRALIFDDGNSSTYSVSQADWFKGGAYGGQMSWRQKAGIADDASPYSLYGICLYVALNNIFGGSSEMNPGTFAEFYVQAAMLLVGSSVWAYVIGSACGIIATLDPAHIEYRQTIDELNYFCREQNLPSELAARLREYFRNTIHLIRSRRYEGLLRRMSTRLRGDAAYRMCEFRLRSVPYLVHPDLEPEFMCSLAIKYSTNVYSKLERVPCTELFIVERGVVAKRGKLGMAGACFGKDVILSSDLLRDMGDAIALTFVQSVALTQSTIFELLPNYPQAYYVVRKAALRMALVRALSKAAAVARRTNGMKYGKTIVDIFDDAMEEAMDALCAKRKEQEKH